MAVARPIPAEAPVTTTTRRARGAAPSCIAGLRAFGRLRLPLVLGLGPVGPGARLVVPVLARDVGHALSQVLALAGALFLAVTSFVVAHVGLRWSRAARVQAGRSRRRGQRAVTGC